jgi:hypothetical protein
MTRIVFMDFDEFSDSIGGMAGEFMPTARSTREWWVQNVASGGVQMQTFQIGGQSTFAGDGKQSQITLLIPLSDPARNSRLVLADSEGPALCSHHIGSDPMGLARHSIRS